MSVPKRALLAVVAIRPSGRGHILAVHQDEPDLPMHQRGAYLHAETVGGVIVALPVVADLRPTT